MDTSQSLTSLSREELLALAAELRQQVSEMTASYAELRAESEQRIGAGNARPSSTRPNPCSSKTVRISLFMIKLGRQFGMRLQVRLKKQSMFRKDEK